jgi:replicative DNA helicase
MERLEHTILRNLTTNDEYVRKVIPFLNEDYFSGIEDKLLFNEIRNFITKYNVPPSLDALLIEVDRISGKFASDEVIANMKQTVESFRHSEDETTMEWLVDMTEKFCQDKALFNAMTKSLSIMDGSEKKLAKGSIPQLLTDALSVSFDPHVGHDYFGQADSRFEYYHRKEEKIPFDLEYFNLITNGGVENKTLNIIMGPIGGGKSLGLCHLAACYLHQGLDVLYITLELAEEKVAKRIDANLLNLDFNDLMELNKGDYINKIEKLSNSTRGKLIIKEYPPATASVSHFRSLLNELRLKKKFVPKVIIVDYLNLAVSARYRNDNNVGSYRLVQSVAEELRGLAVENNLPLWSATQLNRGGMKSSDPGMTDTSESMGLPATCDFMVIIVLSEELQAMKQVMWKQVKNRYGDETINRRFLTGVDKTKMKLFDLEESAQSSIPDEDQMTEQSYQSVASLGKDKKEKFKGLSYE